MPRPLKLNEIPVAPFNLREIGPLHVAEAERRLRGKAYRAATGAKIDPRATIDPSPCPACASQVEWASTTKRSPAGGIVERYLYARCRGKTPHRWDFRHKGEGAVVPPTPPAAREGGMLTAWLDAQIEEYRAKIDKLAQIRRLASEVEDDSPAPTPPAPNGHAHH